MQPKKCQPYFGASRVDRKLLLECCLGGCEPCKKLLDVQQKIDDAHQKIGNMRRTLELLLEDERELAKLRNDNHDMLTNRLPTEVISQIFVRCQRSGGAVASNDKGSRRNPLKSALTLGRVCRSWRTIVQGTPQLWTVFSPRIRSPYRAEPATILRDWLGRSGSLPLSLHFVMRDVQPSDPIDVLQDAFETAFTPAIAHANRWKTLILDVPSFLLPWISDALSGIATECLVDVGVQTWNLYPISRVAVHFHVLRLALAPTRLSISNTDFLAHLPISMGLERVTKLSVHPLPPRAVMRLVQNAPVLTDLTIECLNWRDDDPILSSPLTLDSLLSLTLQNANGQSLNTFVLPSLVSLGIENIRDHDQSGAAFWSCVSAWLLRSGCSIRTLAIEGDHPQRGDRLSETLAIVQDLEHLSVKGYILHGFLLKEMATKSQEATFLKNLRSLYIETSAYYGIVRPGLATLLTNMTAGQPRSLESMEFWYQDPVEISRNWNPDEGTTRAFLDARRDLDLKILECTGQDVLEGYRVRHGLHA